MKTKQEIFDQVSVHLMTQKTPSLDRGECRYRGRFGRQCAVGCLIKDEYYNDAFEGVAVSIARPNLPEKYGLLNAALLASGVDISDSSIVALLEELQKLHDTVSAEFWGDKLSVIANRLSLTFTPDN